jgi:membrane fusion protein (multidrug efflux system)
MKRTRTIISPVIGFAFLALAGCSQQQSAHGGFTMPPMPVEVAQVAVQTVADRFDAVGNVEAIEAISVVSEIDASVVALPFTEGGAIKKGDLIAQLDDSQLSAEVGRAEAVLAQSQSSYQRIKSIVEQGAGAPQDLDDAAASLKVAEASLALAKARLAKTRIVAPFSGMIGARRVSVGTFLRIGQTVTDLANIDEIRISFSVPERFLVQLMPGAEVMVSTSVYPGYEVKGTIFAIEPMLDPATRNARVIAHVLNPDRKFRPGMSADVSVVLSERANALTVPSEAVFANGNQSFVYIVKPDSSVARVAVALGTRLTDVVEILKGLDSGAQVVRAGHQKLFDGAHVLPITSQKSQGAS